MIEITRKRYVIIDDNNRIFCGLARAYQFKPVDNIGDTAIKTYLSSNKAKAGFLSSWERSTPEDFETGRFKVVEVIESLREEPRSQVKDSR